MKEIILGLAVINIESQSFVLFPKALKASSEV